MSDENMLSQDEIDALLQGDLGLDELEEDDENFGGSGKGRVEKARRANGSYDTFDYHGSTDVVKTRSSYDSSGVLMQRLEYASDGTHLTTSSFFAGSGRLKTLVDHASGHIFDYYDENMHHKYFLYLSYTHKIQNLQVNENNHTLFQLHKHLQI